MNNESHCSTGLVNANLLLFKVIRQKLPPKKSYLVAQNTTNYKLRGRLGPKRTGISRFQEAASIREKIQGCLPDVPGLGAWAVNEETFTWTDVHPHQDSHRLVWEWREKCCPCDPGPD